MWVLIIVMWSSGGGGTTAYFENEGLCRHAKVDLLRSFGNERVYIECYPTGKKPE